MKHDYFSDEYTGEYEYCLLIPRIDMEEISKHYVSKLNIDPNQLLVLSLYQDPNKKKTSASDMREYLEEVVEVLQDCGVKHVLVADADYFKVFAGAKSSEGSLGYFIKKDGYIMSYVPNYRGLFYNPESVGAKIDQALGSINSLLDGTYIPPGSTVIKHESYPSDLISIKNQLNELHSKEFLACDIETYHLKFYKAGLGSISFAWSQNEGMAFLIENDPAVKQLLKQFFDEYKGNIRYHNAAFDVTVLVYQLYMDNLLDQEGLLLGLDTLCRNLHCTRIISYLATNSCAGNELGLKDQAREFIGNYAVDVTDITKLPTDVLLRYNLQDTLSTNYVYDKHYPTMVADSQLDIYQSIFIPALKDVIQMQLTGMPLHMPTVIEVNNKLSAIRDETIDNLNSSRVVKKFIQVLADEWAAARNLKPRVKRVTHEDYTGSFNPNSPKQIQRLIYEVLELPILELTKSKQPATGKKVLKSLKNHTTDKDIHDLLDNLIEYKDVDKLLTDFLPSMLDAPEAPNGWHFIYGNFNLGGTVSGRLSSSQINLQNIPSTGSKYASMIKQCFMAPPGWLFVGLDFDSLEDKISALTTKDTNKLLVYTDGFDGHSFRAFSYWPEKMPDIDPSNVNSINSISDKYPQHRQASKEPTFLLTYWGTYHGLMKNCGFSKEEAQGITQSYDTLYAESKQYILDKTSSGYSMGYVDVAFGLRVRTPIMKQTIPNASSTPYEAQAEFRTAANACGQSYCLLNSRAGSEVMSQVRNSKYRLSIKPCAQIHDAQYYLIEADVSILEYLNRIVTRAASWQELPEIQHDTVKLSGSLDIFYPTWDTSHTIKNREASVEELIEMGEEIYSKTYED